jgi:hypothetical protein
MFEMRQRNVVLCVFNRGVNNVGPLYLGLGRPASHDFTLDSYSCLEIHTIEVSLPKV